MSEWWKSAPLADGGDWWSAAPKAKSVPKVRPGLGAMVGRSGSVNDPYDYSDGRSRKGLRKGAFYVDRDGNIRRNDNFDAGNPIVVAAKDRTVEPPPKKGFVRQRVDDFVGPAVAAVQGIKRNYERNSVSEAEAQEARRRAAAKGTKPIDELQAMMADERRQWSGDQQRGPVRRAIGDATYAFRDGMDLVGNVGALALSPLTGALDVGLRPVARGMERVGIGVEDENLGLINTALLGVRPAPGRVYVPRKGAPKPPPKPARVPAVDKLQKLAAIDAAAARRAAAEYQAAGIQPTLADVGGESARGVIRDAASRMTPAREAVTDFADTRAMALPGRIGEQARAVISSDTRTPQQIQAALAASRTAKGDQMFGAVRGERVPLSEDAVQALRSPDGREAIRQAAKDALNSLDPEVRNMANELNRLVDSVIDQPGRTEITVGMAQAISKALLDSASAVQRGGRNYSASQLGDLGRAVRNNAREQVGGYDAALKAWEADSRLIDAAETGKSFLARNTDEFAASLQGMTPEEIALARATARRALEAKAGETLGGASNIARTVAMAPEQQARNAALLGQDDAARLQTNLALEARAFRNAQDIAPRQGPQSANRLMDQQAVAGVENGVGAAFDAVSGNVPGLVERGWRWFKMRGINDDEARQLAEMAIDPAKLDDVLTYIERRFGPQARQQFIEWNSVGDALKVGAYGDLINRQISPPRKSNPQPVQ